jgi:hypothetical protein
MGRSSTRQGSEHPSHAICSILSVRWWRSVRQGSSQARGRKLHPWQPRDMNTRWDLLCGARVRSLFVCACFVLSLHVLVGRVLQGQRYEGQEPGAESIYVGSSHTVCAWSLAAGQTKTDRRLWLTTLSLSLGRQGTRSVCWAGRGEGFLGSHLLLGSRSTPRPRWELCFGSSASACC